MQTYKDITLIKYKQEANEVHITKEEAEYKQFSIFTNSNYHEEKDSHKSALPEALYMPFTLQHLSEYKPDVINIPVLINCDDILAK
jgi:hypothetical protein